MSVGRPPGPIRLLWRLRHQASKWPAPWRIAARHKRTFVGRIVMESTVNAPGSVDLRLKELASLRASALVGCPW